MDEERIAAETREGERLAALARAVRESTLQRLRRVPKGRENWRPAPGRLSVGDLAQHLLDADAWLHRKRRDPELEPMVAVAGQRPVADRVDYEKLLADLVASGRRREELLAGLDAAALATLVPDARFGGAVSLWWVIVRGNLDHEAHHRGQLALYMRLLEGA